MRILFVEPYESSLFCFRKELLDKLILEGHQIILCIGSSKKVLDEYGGKVKIIDVPINIKDKGIISNIKLLLNYKKIIKQEKPELIISYMIKPNIYCGFFAKKIPMIANITGLGTMFNKKTLLSKIGVFLYRHSFKNVKYIFFQNSDGLLFFNENRIPLHSYRIIPGSGVALQRFTLKPIQETNSKINFLFASRAIKEKGFKLLVEAIPEVVKHNKNVHFNFLVSNDDIKKDYSVMSIFDSYKDYVSVLPRTNDMEHVYHNNDFLVSPSYYREGISNVLLESLACGRPIITTIDNAGCKEVLQDGINGFGVVSKDSHSLIESLIKASLLSKQEIFSLGCAGRKFIEERFDREIVIKHYLEIIKEVSNLNNFK